MKQNKTNVMRILERAGIDYEPIYYDIGDAEFSGELVADITGIPHEQSFR